MQELLGQLSETQKLIGKNAEDIARLQRELTRLQKDGKSVDLVRAKLGQFHALQVLTLRELLQETLNDIGAE